MAEPHVISALKQKRRDLSGELIELDKRRQRLRRQIAAVDDSLVVFGYTGNPENLFPRRRYNRMFKRGEVKRTVATILRTADVPPTDREIALQIIRDKGWNEDSEDLIKRVVSAVWPARQALELQRSCT